MYFDFDIIYKEYIWDNSKELGQNLPKTRGETSRSWGKNFRDNHRYNYVIKSWDFKFLELIYILEVLLHHQEDNLMYFGISSVSHEGVTALTVGIMTSTKAWTHRNFKANMSLAE